VEWSAGRTVSRAWLASKKIVNYLCEEFLKAIGHHDDPQVRLSTAEVMTIPLVACAIFSGNLEASRSFSDEYGYIEKAISESRFNRRLHAIDPSLWRLPL
jgi:hypothetical protein